jgi:hypothetical protein
MTPSKKRLSPIKAKPATSELESLLEQAREALQQNQVLLRDIASMAREGRRDYTIEGGQLLRKIEVTARQGLPDEPFKGHPYLLEDQS